MAKRIDGRTVLDMDDVTEVIRGVLLDAGYPDSIGLLMVAGRIAVALKDEGAFGSEVTDV